MVTYKGRIRIFNKWLCINQGKSRMSMQPYTKYFILCKDMGTKIVHILGCDLHRDFLKQELFKMEKTRSKNLSKFFNEVWII
jgi:hypothetical protein